MLPAAAAPTIDRLSGLVTDRVTILRKSGLSTWLLSWFSSLLFKMGRPSEERGHVPVHLHDGLHVPLGTRTLRRFGDASQHFTACLLAVGNRKHFDRRFSTLDAEP